MKPFDVFPLYDVEIVRGRGCNVWDADDNKYLDLYGGHAVISIGHCHPHYIECVSRQLNRLGFYSNSVQNHLQTEFAEQRIVFKASGYEDYSLFLINSGAEANENALKLASFYNGRTRVIASAGAFHGRTSLAVEATDNPKINAPINKNSHVTFLPLNDTEAFVSEIAKGDVCAVIVECIQGVGGIHLANKEFMQAVRKACDEHNTVLVCDEVQCGYGRSGKFFAHQYLDVKPDLITVAKGIACGFPMGGLLISPKFKPVYGMLGTTFGGNHLACVAALAVLDVIENEKLVSNAAEVGEHIMERCREIEEIKDIRGRGLMIGLEFDKPVKELRKNLIFEQRVFTGGAGTNILRLLPPLCLTTGQADDFVERLKNALVKF